VGLIFNSDGLEILEDLDIFWMIGWLARDGGSGLKSWRGESL